METLAAILRAAKPSSLALGSGFFSSGRREDIAMLENVLQRLGPDLQEFAFGGYDLETTTSDYITHPLSHAWTGLESLSLRQVRFVSPHAVNIEAQHDAFWRCYPPPKYRLKHLSISFVRPIPASAPTKDVAEDESWLHWLIAKSASSLASVDLANLSEALPEDAYQILKAAAPRLRRLSITEYEGDELLGNLLAHGADNLVSLTLGGLSSIGLAGGRTMEILASPQILEGRRNLQYLEIQNLQLFERLDLVGAMRNGQLEDIRHIVLTNASRVHPEVQLLDAHCKQMGVTLLVRR